MSGPWFTSSLSTLTRTWIQNTQWNNSGKTPFWKESESNEQDVTDLRIITWHQVWAGSSMPYFDRCYGKISGLFGLCWEVMMAREWASWSRCFHSSEERSGEGGGWVSLNLKFTNLARLGRHPSPLIHCLYFLHTRVTGVCHYTCSFILGTRNSNSDPHTCMVSTLLTKLSCQSYKYIK